MISQREIAPEAAKEAPKANGPPAEKKVAPAAGKETKQSLAMQIEEEAEVAEGEVALLVAETAIEPGALGEGGGSGDEVAVEVACA